MSNLLRILDLPDEALELLERGELSEGHGRALLLAEGNDTRRALARRAAAEQWSVRALEARAREGASGVAEPAPKDASHGGPHPDQADACATIADALSVALGAEVRVSVARAGGYRAELTFASAQDALALAERTTFARD